MPRARCSTADDHKSHSISHGEASTGIAHLSPKSTLMLSKSGVTSRLIAHLRYHCKFSIKQDRHQMRWSCGTSKWGATMARAVLNVEPVCNDLPDEILAPPVCNDLPDEILEQHVLPLLPLASLCRFRAVSKKWNDYIAHPHLATLHTVASPPEDFALINIRTSLPFNALGGWEILDVVNGKFFPLSQDFMGRMDGTHGTHGTQGVVLAADGGLVLIWYSLAESSPNHTLLVCNPLLKAVKVIPSLPGWVYARHYDCVVMSTDRTSMTYEIVVFHPRVNHYQVECIDIFQSKTGTWRRVVNPVVPSQECWREDARFVRFRSGLYRLYRRQTDGHRDMKPHLAEFDKTTGVGSIVPLRNSFHSAWIDFKFPELVVSQDRLFCVCKWGTSNHGYRFVEIFEIFPEEHYCKLVTRMPLYDLMWLHGKEMYNQAWEVMDGWPAIMDKYVDPVVATGCASSILVCSCIGRSMAYDLVSNSWWRYSDGNLLQQHMYSTESGRYLECRNLGLSLCQP